VWKLRAIFLFWGIIILRQFYYGFALEKIKAKNIALKQMKSKKRISAQKYKVITI
jgi:hypothetical protein